jgi:hypothetical protein
LRWALPFVLVLVGYIGCEAQFFVCLAQKLFGSLGMAAELTVVGALSLADTSEGCTMLSCAAARLPCR